jgi:hypothetical protein
MSRQSTPSTIATIGIDIGKNTFHLIGLWQTAACPHGSASTHFGGKADIAEAMSDVRL